MPLKLEYFTAGFARFLRTDNNSELMAVDGRSTSAEDMWDGTGASDSGTENWTRSGIGSESTASKYSGTNGLDTGVAASGDRIRFDYGSDRDLGASFDSVTFWMQPKAYPTGSDLKAMFAPSGSDTRNGASVSVSDYVANMDLDVWQRVTIPLDDFNLTANVGRFILRCTSAANQQFYLDVFEMLNSTSDGPYRFRVDAGAGDQWRVSSVVLGIAAGDTGWDSDHFADISSSLESGLIFRHRDLSESLNLTSTVFKSNMDLFSKFTPSEPFAFGNNELLVIFKYEPTIETMIVTDDDVLEFVVRDDLSTLANMRAYLRYGKVIPE